MKIRNLCKCSLIPVETTPPFKFPVRSENGAFEVTVERPPPHPLSNGLNKVKEGVLPLLDGIWVSVKPPAFPPPDPP